MSRKPQDQFQVSELHYYFDAKEKDALDGTKFCNKSRVVLALRDRLLALPDQDFEAAIRTLNGLLDQHNKSEQGKNSQDKSKDQDALKLYETGSSGELTSTSKITAI